MSLGAPPLPHSRGRSTLPLLRGEDTQWEDIAFSEYCTDDGCYHRMVRDDEWKLNYYHGQPPQLFNFEGRSKRIARPSRRPHMPRHFSAFDTKSIGGLGPGFDCRADSGETRRHTTPRQMGRNIQPADQYRWNLLPEMDYLKNEKS